MKVVERWYVNEGHREGNGHYVCDNRILVSEHVMMETNDWLEILSLNLGLATSEAIKFVITYWHTDEVHSYDKSTKNCKNLEKMVVLEK